MAEATISAPQADLVNMASRGLKPMVGRAQQEVKSAIHRDLINKLDLEKLFFMEDARARQQLLAIIFQLVSEQGIPFSARERERIANEVLDEVFGLGP